MPSLEMHDCNENLLKTKRTLKNDTIAIVMQCTICGKQRGGALSKNSEKNIDELPNFDYSLSNAVNKFDDSILINFLENNEIYKQLKDEYGNNHDLLVRTAEGILSLATIEKASSFINSKFSDLDNEPKLTDWLVDFLKEDFYIKQKLRGKHILTEKIVEIDLMLYPKKHLIESGFEENYFGIEVKYLDPMHDMFRKASEMFWQTMSYRNSVFQIKDKMVSPAFTLVFTNLAFEGQREQLIHREYIDFKSMWRAYRHLANHAGVGTMEILEPRKRNHVEIDGKCGFKIYFAIREYFTKSREGEYKLNNKHVIKKKPAGNIS